MKNSVKTILLVASFVLTGTAHAQTGSPKWHLEFGPKRKVEATLSTTCGIPHKGATLWDILIPAAPTLPNQTEVLSSLTVEGSAAENKILLEEKGLHRSILHLTVPVTPGSYLQGQVSAKVVYSAMMASVKLVPGAPGKPVPNLKSEDYSAAMGTDNAFDYHSPDFQQWLDEKELRINSVSFRAFLKRMMGQWHITDMSPDVEQAIFETYKMLVLHRLYTYQDHEDTVQVSKLCRVSKLACGGISIVSVAVSRANGIPSRLKAGRWLIPANKTTKMGQMPSYVHVRNETFISGIGWVTEDGAEFLLNPEDKLLDYIGHDEGNFLTFHIDPNLQYRVNAHDERTAIWGQGMLVVAQGTGPDTDQSWTDTWDVKFLDGTTTKIMHK